MSDFVQIGLRESGQNECTDGRLDGRLQDFVNEATQIEILRNFEQNRRLQNNKFQTNQITKSHDQYNFSTKQANLSSTRGPSSAK